MHEWKCNKIFLATEDKNIAQIFKNAFGDLCIMFDREYVEYVPGKAIADFHIDRPNDYYLQGKDYLTQMVLLSTCNSFITARCSGAAGVMMMANDFENVLAFNLGKYNLITLE